MKKTQLLAGFIGVMGLVLLATRQGVSADPAPDKKDMAKVVPALGATPREGQRNISADVRRMGDSVRLTQALAGAGVSPLT